MARLCIFTAIIVLAYKIEMEIMSTFLYNIESLSIVFEFDMNKTLSVDCPSW